MQNQTTSSYVVPDQSVKRTAGSISSSVATGVSRRNTGFVAPGTNVMIPSEYEAERNNLLTTRKYQPAKKQRSTPYVVVEQRITDAMGKPSSIGEGAMIVHFDNNEIERTWHQENISSQGSDLESVSTYMESVLNNENYASSDSMSIRTTTTDSKMLREMLANSYQESNASVELKRDEANNIVSPTETIESNYSTIYSPDSKVVSNMKKFELPQFRYDLRVYEMLTQTLGQKVVHDLYNAFQNDVYLAKSTIDQEAYGNGFDVEFMKFTNVLEVFKHYLDTFVKYGYLTYKIQSSFQHAPLEDLFRAFSQKVYAARTDIHLNVYRMQWASIEHDGLNQQSQDVAQAMQMYNVYASSSSARQRLENLFNVRINWLEAKELVFVLSIFPDVTYTQAMINLLYMILHTAVLAQEAITHLKQQPLELNNKFMRDLRSACKISRIKNQKLKGIILSYYAIPFFFRQTNTYKDLFMDELILLCGMQGLVCNANIDLPSSDVGMIKAELRQWMIIVIEDYVNKINDTTEVLTVKSPSSSLDINYESFYMYMRQPVLDLVKFHNADGNLILQNKLAIEYLHALNTLEVLSNAKEISGPKQAVKNALNNPIERAGIIMAIADYYESSQRTQLLEGKPNAFAYRLEKSTLMEYLQKPTQFETASMDTYINKMFLYMSNAEESDTYTIENRMHSKAFLQLLQNK